MAILRSLDGKFYEIEDDDLSDYELDADRVKEVMAEIGDEQPGPAGPNGDFGEGGAPPQVVIQVFGGNGSDMDGPPPGFEDPGPDPVEPETTPAD